MLTQSYNRYFYCLNNPLRYTDPSGYTFKPDDWNDAPVLSGYYFGPGPSGGLGAGSGNHWSDSYRSVFGNFMLMNQRTFTSIYGNVNYWLAYASVTGDLKISTGETAQENWRSYLEENRKQKAEKDFQDNMKIAAARNIGYGKRNPGDPPGGKGYIISFFNGTAAFGYGATIDIGGVIDSYGNSNMYFTIGWTGGFGATAGMGMHRTNNGFRTSDLGGSAVDISFSFPFLKLYGIRPFGGAFAGDWIYGGGLPGENTRVGGFNVGVGTGYFVSHTYTFIAPLPDNNFWCRPCRR